MEKDEIVHKIIEVSRDIFDIDDLEMNTGSHMSEIEGWDSFTKISLFSSLEREFKVKFTIVDMDRMKSVADIVDIVTGRL